LGHRRLEKRVQVLAMLGSVSGKKVVELGAGIGRFTGALAATADSVLAMDFMETLIEENKKTHGHRSLTTHILAS
jgi:phosphoethanolamine N-methyltransferase